MEPTQVMYSNFSDWAQVLTIVGANIILIVSMIGTIVMVWLHQDKKITAIIEAVNRESKDFHSKLISVSLITERLETNHKRNEMQSLLDEIKSSWEKRKSE